MNQADPSTSPAEPAANCADREQNALVTPKPKRVRVRKYKPRPKRPGIRKRGDRRRTRAQAQALRERVIYLAQLHPGLRPKDAVALIGPHVISHAWVTRILKTARKNGVPGVLPARSGRDARVEEIKAKVKEDRRIKLRPLTPGEQALADLLGELPYRPTKANLPDV